jgi:hypothetical protein
MSVPRIALEYKELLDPDHEGIRIVRWTISVADATTVQHDHERSVVIESRKGESGSPNLVNAARACAQKLPQIVQWIESGLENIQGLLRNSTVLHVHANKSEEFYTYFIRLRGATSPEVIGAIEMWGIHYLLKAVNLVCSQDPHDYEYVVAYAAWQDYCLIKSLAAYRVGKPNEFLDYQSLIDSEFGFSFRTLVSLLNTPRYAVAFRQLWSTGLLNRDSRRSGEDYGTHPVVVEGQPVEKSMEVSRIGHEPSKVSSPIAGQSSTTPLSAEMERIQLGTLDSWIRERLRTGMFLHYHGDEQSPRNRDTPLPAPDCFEISSGSGGRLGREIVLHTRFRTTGVGSIELNRFLRNELLPNYNLPRALELVSLRSPSLIPSARRWPRLPLPGLLAIMAVAFMLLLWQAPTVVLTAMIIAPIPALFLLVWLDALDVLLPRVTGGILVGYFWLFMASETWYFALAVCQSEVLPRWLFWLIEWGIAVLVSGLYIYHEAHARIPHRPEAIRRSRTVLVLAVAEAVSLGAFLACFARSVGRHVLPPIEYARLCEIPPFFGGDYPIGALITFAPLSVALGILLQTLWQEQPITASVWQPQSR